jgi:hypothetical protein
MYIELDAGDLCCMDGASSLMIDNLARMSAPFGIAEDVLRAGSVFEAAEMVFELVPDPYLEHMVRFMPRRVAEMASRTVTRESRMLTGMCAETFDRKAVAAAFDDACPIAMLASKGVASFGFEASFLRGDEIELNHFGPVMGEWTIWEGCAKMWTHARTELSRIRKANLSHFDSATLESALESRVEDIRLLESFRKPRYDSYCKVNFDIFAWKVELSFH